MTEIEKAKAAREFAEYWKDKGYEKGEGQKFWLSLLGDVLGVEDPTKYIEFEVPIKLNNGGRGFIDGYIARTHILIEQKGRNVGLLQGIKQSDGSLMSPYGQAKRYADVLPYDDRIRWIITCNFKELFIYDMNNPHGDPEKILLSELEKEYYRLQFIVKENSALTKKEETVSVEAGTRVGKIYDALLAQYKDPDEDSLRSLNMLCVRLVFCLYAEDSGLFGSHTMFHDYMKSLSVKDMRRGLIDLFKVLDTPVKERDKYLDDDLAAFPYVNGGLFADENIEIPNFTQEIAELLLEGASENFDWSSISPTIFGAVFESTLNPETRRSGGMHYTSIENIHKVIDPLFLNDLREELDGILEQKVTKTREAKLETFREKLGGLTFLDPACGSGNFLTETFVSLRRLENEALRAKYSDQVLMDFGDTVKVHIDQFYGIEINDFAVSVAKTALWIAEHQMLKETAEILERNIDFLPLKTYANIVEGNALRIDWETVVPKDKLNYIMGNPPFVGYSLQSKEQKEDILSIYVDEKGKPYKTAGKIDYVAGWYFKASTLMENSDIRTAFVSTNSITQGEQVAGVWKPLYDRFNIHIDFAHRTFRWDSEASLKAHVHCVIVGFSVAENNRPKQLFSDEQMKIVENINFYLIEAPTVFLESLSKPICNVPTMKSGGKPVEGGHLIFTEKEMNDFIKEEPKSEKYFRPFMGSDDFINGHGRWCLWLVGISPKDLFTMPKVLDRVEKVREFRLESVKEATRAYSEYPTRFMEIKQPESDYLMIPATSSENRKYIPIGYLSKNVIASNAASFVPNATLYHFGVLTSNIHMAWMRTVCGRLEMRYRYSVNIVYNNFPWPTPTEEQKHKIEKTAQAILDARALYSNCSYAETYGDKMYLFPQLVKAHQLNDKAVMEAYGFWGKYNSESACVAELMKMYQELTK
ncbi:MAG: class I SAM-dependent DNA methyltransferase [Clostridia bacterium]|nr:class I SAM-dependent DNA methyltransferase [Clostridia bacterium]